MPSPARSAYGHRLLTDPVLAQLHAREARLAVIVSALFGLQELVPAEDRELRHYVMAAFGRACALRHLARAQLDQAGGDTR